LHAVTGATAHRGRRRRPPPCAAVGSSPPKLRASTSPRWAPPPLSPLSRAPPASPESSQPRRPHGQGWDCKPPNLPKVLSVNQGYSCDDLDLYRVPVQKDIFNSKRIMLKFVKFLENHSKFEKLQTQFSQTPGDEHYNFCYTHLGCFLIGLAWKIEMWKT
jgi:hypothetical protein